MTRFHFEIVNGHTISDPSGMELPTEWAAEQVAQEIAKQVAIDQEDDSLKNIVVKTNDGKTIYTTPIKTK